MQETVCPFSEDRIHSVTKEENLRCLSKSLWGVILLGLEIALAFPLKILSKERMTWWKENGDRISSTDWPERESSNYNRTWSLAHDFCPEESRRKGVWTSHALSMKESPSTPMTNVCAGLTAAPSSAMSTLRTEWDKSSGNWSMQTTGNPSPREWKSWGESPSVA